MAKGCSVTVASRKTMVSPARRMLRAISLGVFWRDAPSTNEIIRSRKLSPGFELTRTTMRSDSTRVPPVTDDRSPPDSRMTGADFAGDGRFVDRGDALDDLAVTGDQLAGVDDAAVAQLEQARRRLLHRAVGLADEGHGLRPGLAQRVGLGLAPAVGHRLGEVGEHHPDPHPAP